MATFTINGSTRSFEGDPDMPLLWYLRDDLGLTGTKFGCGGGFCGSCTVHIDGQAVRSCQTPMSGVANRKLV
jgi:isoquinoline 1-oxidoreductase alpha subunit